MFWGPWERSCGRRSKRVWASPLTNKVSVRKHCDCKTGLPKCSCRALSWYVEQIYDQTSSLRAPPHILELKPKLNKMFMAPTDEWSLISHSAVYEVRIWRGYLKMWQRIMKPRHWKWHGIAYWNAVQYTVSFSSSAVCHGVCGSIETTKRLFPRANQ